METYEYQGNYYCIIPENFFINYDKIYVIVIEYNPSISDRKFLIEFAKEINNKLNFKNHDMKEVQFIIVTNPTERNNEIVYPKFIRRHIKKEELI